MEVPSSNQEQTWCVDGIFRSKNLKCLPLQQIIRIGNFLPFQYFVLLELVLRFVYITTITIIHSALPVIGALVLSLSHLVWRGFQFAGGYTYIHSKLKI